MKKQRLLNLVVMLVTSLACSVFMISSIEAAIYYVDKDNPSASDDNPGTEEAGPWKTLTKAGNTARAGDTVLVKAGIYNETLTVANSGTPGNLIIFKAYPGDECKGEYGGTKSDCRVVLDGQDTIAYGVNIRFRSYIRIEGFEIKGYIGSYDGAVFIRAPGDPDQDTIEIVNCYIHDNGWSHDDEPGTQRPVSGICVRGPGYVYNLFIENNEIFHNGRDGIMGGGYGVIIRGNNIHHNDADAIEGGGRNVLFEYNKIYDGFHSQRIVDGTHYGNHEDAWACGALYDSVIRYNIICNYTQLLYFDHHTPGEPGTQVQNVDIYGNVFYTSGYYTEYGGSAPSILFNVQSPHASVPPNVAHVRIHSNTFGFPGPQGYAILIATAEEGNIEDVKIYDNIFYKCGIVAYEAKGAASCTSDYNLFYDHAAPAFEGAHSITATDPLFADYQPLYFNKPPDYQERTFSHLHIADFDHKDFHLGSKSLCIDAGNANLASVVTLPSPFIDLDGGARPYGAGYDIGAYEYGAVPLKGDVNRDGLVNIQDLQACVNHILGKQDWGTRADVNGDGKVDESDAKEIVNIILSK